MNRPQGLLLTAWIMVALLVAGWLRSFYRVPTHFAYQHPQWHLFNTVVFVVLRIIAFVCIVYYARGRNWARIAVLLTSVLTILGLLQLRHEDSLGKVMGAAWGLLAVFLLYWLNTRSVREFFKRGASAIEHA